MVDMSLVKTGMEEVRYSLALGVPKHGYDSGSILKLFGDSILGVTCDQDLLF